MARLYAEIRPVHYREALAPKEETVMRWRTAAIKRAKPNAANQEPELTESAAYADAAGKSRVVDAEIIAPARFKKGNR